MKKHAASQDKKVMWKQVFAALYSMALCFTRPARAVLHCIFGPRFIGPDQRYRIPHRSVRRSYGILRMLDELRVDPQKARWLYMMLEGSMGHPMEDTCHRPISKGEEE